MEAPTTTMSATSGKTGFNPALARKIKEGARRADLLHAWEMKNKQEVEIPQAEAQFQKELNKL